MLNTLIAFITNKITGFESGHMNIWEFVEWTDTYGKVKYWVNTGIIMIVVIIALLVIFKVSEMFDDSFEIEEEA